MAKNIVKSFAQGNIGEKIVQDIFNSTGFVCEKTQAKLAHDLVFDGDQHIEVKYDIMSSKTGNLAIEFFNSKKGQASGISATLAKYWAHVVQNVDGSNSVYIALVEKLKAWLESNKPLKTVTHGGDNNAALYIYECSRILGDTSPFKLISKECNLREVLNEL